jgi:hypothetical protein
VTEPRQIAIEANLRIPSLSIKSDGPEPTQAINNSGNRYTKMITVGAVPKNGDPLAVTVGLDLVFDCVVTRSDWSDDRGIFIVSCSFARRSITPHEYQSLINDPAWTLKQLP